MTEERIYLACRVLFFAALTYITYGSLSFAPHTPDAGQDIMRWLASIILGDPEASDKITHFIAYGGLGFLAIGAKFLVASRQLLLIPLLGIYGIIMEQMQRLGGVREPSFLDALANCLGAGCGVIGGMIAFMLLAQIIRRGACL